MRKSEKRVMPPYRLPKENREVFFELFIILQKNYK